MHSHSRLLMFVFVLLLLTAVTAYGQSISPGTVTMYSTIRCIGVEWPCTGDSDHDATCQTQYRVQGSGTWLDAMPLMRGDCADHNGFFGSIFNLNAGTTYEVKVTITDPDGGGTSYTGTVATRQVPAQPTGGRTFHVVPGTSGGDGSSGNPFRGIATAEAAAQPGDIFLLHAGDYGLAQLTKSGTTDNWIVWKAAGDGNAIIQGMYIKSWVWVDGLYYQAGSQHLQNADWINLGRSNALTVPDGSAASNVCVTRCTFRDFFHNIKCRSGSTWYVADNDIRGDRDPLTGGLQGEGIELSKSAHNIVCYNKFRRCADPISYPGNNNDIYGNDIQDSSDDGVESDQGKTNLRIFENKITNTCNNVFTFQPFNYGPWYFIKNQVVLTHGKLWKFTIEGPTNVDDRLFIANNTFIMPTRASEFAQCLLNALHKNNLYISYTASSYVLRGAWDTGSSYQGPGLSSTPFWMTDWDYNGWDIGGKATPFEWYGSNYSTFASFASGLGVDSHGKAVDRTQIFDWVQPSTTYDWAVPNYVLKSGTNAAVDAGVALPNINDGYTGTAPDMGAHERGVTPPQYGPRPIGSTYSLTVNSGAGDGSYAQGTVVNVFADAPQGGYVFSRWTGDTDHVANPDAANTTVTMPSHATTITATYVVAPTYALTVNSGTGDGSYVQGAVVNIAASAPPAGYAFSKWTGDTDHVANHLASNTTVTMPSHATTVTATYAAVPTYTLTVTSGTGDGSYAPGAVVNISADAPGAGEMFDSWTGAVAYIADVNAANTTVTMPASNITVTATYTSDMTYSLTVNSGTGDGNYLQGTVVNIAADAPQSGYAFDEWTGNVAYVANVNAANTTVTMPAQAVTLTATYAAVPTYALTVTSGAGDGTYAQGTVVNIVADAPQTGYAFSGWSGDIAYVANANASSTTVTMPAQAVTVAATYTPTSGNDTFIESSGMVVMEAEHFSTKASGSGSYSAYNWELNTTTSGDSGDSMQVLPNPGVNVGTATDGPVLNFQIAFSTTGVYYCHVRMPALGGTDDSVNVGLDDVLFQSQLANWTGSWSWRLATNPTTVSSAGVHTFNMWMREDGVIADKIILTTNSAYTLVGTDTGPVESDRNGAPVTYTLTVNSGSGDGSYESGEVATIVADAPQTHYHFVAWTGDTDGVTDINDSTTTLTMPSSSITVTATYAVNPQYTLTVTSGTGDGSYYQGDVANIVADAPAAHYHFVAWTGDIAGVANVNASSTTLTMPGANATVTATYAQDSQYALTVTSGTGDGSYYVSDVVNVSADAPQTGYAFSQWTGDVDHVANANNSSTTVTMPSHAVSITATYAPSAGGDTFMESSGMVVMEAEHYSSKDAGTGSYSSCNWSDTDVTGDSGTSMQSLPDTELNCGDGSTAGPALNFKINFSTTGVYYALIRQPALAGNDNSINLAVDDSVFQSNLGHTAGEWRWPKAATSITVSSAGIRTFNIYMREDGYIVDKVILTTNASYSLGTSDLGPAESSRDGTTYTLTVNSGTGDGAYVEDTVVSIVANSPAQGYVFDEWTGDVAYVANVNSSSTTVTMPAQNVTVTATYSAVPTYALTVTSGTGDGSYNQGTVVNVVADAPPTGKAFSQWSGDVDHVANVNNASTTVTMPSHAVSITATYVNVNYTLTVNSGAGDGSYTYQTAVGISADAAPAGKVFSQWVGDVACVANVNSASTTVTMPAQAVTVTATYADILYALSVTSGTGDGNYAYQTVVNIAANTPQSGYQFSKWTGDTAGVANIYASSTTITMPASAASLTATYTSVLYTLTVTNGTGDGNYAYQTVVSIVADTPPSGYQFSKWTGDTAAVANVNSSSTTITMPAANALVTATYTPILYALTVTSGSGDGNYEVNDVVDITADAPQGGYTFDKWTGDTDHVANVNSSSTTVTMPSHATSVTATYELSGSGDTFQESGGMVVMEAEHYSSKAAGTGQYSAHSWNLDTNVSGDSGDCMHELPNNGSNSNDSVTETPVMNYKVNFSTTGTYAILVRFPPLSSFDNALNYGRNGSFINSLSQASTSDWSWSRRTGTITISSTGLHTMNIWMRKDGTIADKIILTTNASYTLSGTDLGPSESQRQ